MDQPQNTAGYVSPLLAVCNYWKSFDLESMRNKLDEVGLKIADLQEDSAQNRKSLAESTKDFRKTAPESNSRPVGLLLKQYQEEIDRLTKRAKHGETAFLEVYQKLVEAPDPAPALSKAFETASHVTELEAACSKMAQELAEYKAESTQIKNQDLTIRKLEEKVRLLEAQVVERERVMEEERQAQEDAANAAALEQLQAREAELAARLSETQTSLASLQQLAQARENALFALQSAGEEARAGQQTELDLAMTELERAQDRLRSLEQEKSTLLVQLQDRAGPNAAAAAAAAAASNGMPGIEENLRAELSAQRELAARLRSEVNSLRAELDESGGGWATRCEGLRSALAAQEQHVAALEQELAARPTPAQMEELRQQLRILQAVGLNMSEVDDGGEGEGGGAGRQSSIGGAGAAGSLEGLLLAKNRKLEHELTMARLKLADSESQLEAAQARESELEATLADKLALINRLEEDLLAKRRPRSGISSSSAAADGSSGPDAQADDGGDAVDTSMLRVLCGQRDRLRQRVQELEEELSHSRQESAGLRSTMAATQADNMALVERLRYLQSFKHSGEKAASAATARSGAGADVEAASSAVEGKYRRMYDEGMNPFKEFQGKERERQKKEMGFTDRAMYLLGKLIFGNPTARLAAFAYLAAIHLLIFASLARMTHHSSEALYQHQQGLVLHGRHDVTAGLHHELPTGGTAGELVVNSTLAGGPAH